VRFLFGLTKYRSKTMRSKGVLTQCIFSRSGYRNSPTGDVDADYAERRGVFTIEIISSIRVMDFPRGKVALRTAKRYAQRDRSVNSTSPPRGDRRWGEEVTRASRRDGRKRERSDR